MEPLDSRTASSWTWKNQIFSPEFHRRFQGFSRRLRYFVRIFSPLALIFFGLECYPQVEMARSFFFKGMRLHS